MTHTDKRVNPIHFGSNPQTTGSGLISKSGFESLIRFWSQRSFCSLRALVHFNFYSRSYKPRVRYQCKYIQSAWLSCTSSTRGISGSAAREPTVRSRCTWWSESESWAMHGMYQNHLHITTPARLTNILEHKNYSTTACSQRKHPLLSSCKFLKEKLTNISENFSSCIWENADSMCQK